VPALAGETISVAVNIAVAAITTRVVVNMNVLIETAFFSVVIDLVIIGDSNKLLAVSALESRFGWTSH
jgi:hypothetical protein